MTLTPRNPGQAIATSHKWVFSERKLEVLNGQMACPPQFAKQNWRGRHTESSIRPNQRTAQNRR